MIIKKSKLKNKNGKGFTPHHFSQKSGGGVYPAPFWRESGAGFTLIEFLIIISIIVILAAISIPAFREFQPGLQLKGAVRNLVTDLRYAQQLTVTEQIEYCLRFFPLEKKYQIMQCNQDEPLLERFLPEEIKTLTTTEFTNNEVRFNPYGAVKESGTIVLENTKNEIRTINVRPSGFVRIAD